MGDQTLLFNLPAKGTKPSKKKPAGIEINRINRKIARRRYYLHKQLPDEFTVFAAERRIKCNYQSFMDIPVGPRFYISELIKMGYEIQFNLKLYIMSETNKRAFKTVKNGHAYQVPAYAVVPEKGIQPTGEMIEIRFVRGSKVVNENREPALEGTLHEHLITVSIEDLKLKHAEFPSKETGNAITHLEEARHWLEEREKARAAQSVLGTYQPHQS